MKPAQIDSEDEDDKIFKDSDLRPGSKPSNHQNYQPTYNQGQQNVNYPNPTYSQGFVNPNP